MGNASRWKAHARSIIARALAETEGRPFIERLSAIDAAYPWGERSRHPYKCWLAVRKEALATLRSPPTLDEVHACQVAHDAVEDGRMVAAEQVLAGAPNRLARPCPVCGRKSGKACIDLTTRAVRLVPHLDRVTGGASGPLFGGAP